MPAEQLNRFEMPYMLEDMPGHTAGHTASQTRSRNLALFCLFCGGALFMLVAMISFGYSISRAKQAFKSSDGVALASVLPHYELLIKLAPGGGLINAIIVFGVTMANIALFIIQWMFILPAILFMILLYITM